MKVFIVSTDNAKAYEFLGTDLGLNKHRLSPSWGSSLQKGRDFNGELVYLKMPYGYQPMVKVIDSKLTTTVYYAPDDVKYINNSEDVNSLNFSGQFIDASNYPNSSNIGYANPLATSDLMAYKNSYPQYSSAEGDNELNQSQMNQIKDSSGGAGKKFMEWLNSKDGKQVVNDSLGLAASLLNKGNDGKVTLSVKNDEEEDDKIINESKKDKEFKILWMHPLTFGMVAISTIVVGLVVLSIVKSAKK